MTTKVIFCTFATEGPPHDLGLPIAGECLEPFVRKVVESGVDEVVSFTPRTLIPILGSRCLRKLNPPPKVFSENYHNVGAGAWKAEILKHVVQTRAVDGDIVMFHDSNWKKYPGILKGFAPTARDYATAAMAVASRTKIFAPPSHILMHTVTSNVFNRLRDPELIIGRRPRDVMDNPAARARCIVLQVSPQTQEFVRLFSAACDVDENLQGGPEAWTKWGGWPKPGFIHNAGEQGIFNALVYGRGFWDLQQDDWLKTELKNIGSHDYDTGSDTLRKWAAKHRDWRGRGA